MKPLFLEDYGVWGIWIAVFPALVVVLFGLFSYFLIQLVVRMAKFNTLGKRVVFSIVGALYTLLALFCCWQGTYNETVYIALPSVLISFLFLWKLNILKLPKKWLQGWKLALIAILVVSAISFYY